jgi:hypothetical protein
MRLRSNISSALDQPRTGVPQVPGVGTWETTNLRVPRSNPQSSLLAVVLTLGALLFTTACKSPHVAVTVQNQTGAEVRLLEVDYPSASFGADHLALGASMHYSIAVTGSGPMKLQYTMPNNAVAQATGPEISEGESGTLSILLTPDGHAEFHPDLHPK